MSLASVRWSVELLKVEGTTKARGYSVLSLRDIKKYPSPLGKNKNAHPGMPMTAASSISGLFSNKSSNSAGAT